jgi:hypothetical protein
MKPTRLLRWYPRTWRERYGEELLALIQDTLDDGRPTWRLRLSVAWGGLRERGHQVGQAAKATVKGPAGPDKVMILIAGLLFAYLPLTLTASPLPARGWQVPAAFDAVLAAVALTGAVVLLGGLAGLPALVRFVRAGGWPTIRRRVVWAAGATVVAGGGVAGVAIVTGSHLSAQLNVSWPYLAALFAAGLAVAAAMGLWATAAAATARHLTLAPRVRTAQLMIGAIIPSAFTATIGALAFWWSVTQNPLWLIAVPVDLGAAIVGAQLRLRVAARKGRRLRAAASGRTTINLSAERTNGRHRA